MPICEIKSDGTLFFFNKNKYNMENKCIKFLFRISLTEGCLYKGVMYIQDQIWNDECKYTCECQDASTGLYRCNERWVIVYYVHIFYLGIRLSKLIQKNKMINTDWMFIYVYVSVSVYNFNVVKVHKLLTLMR